MECYKTISRPGEARLEVKKSEFLAQASCAQTEEEALAALAAARAAHSKARHTAYAYLLREGARSRHSDDGEPAKTAGLPILAAIEGAGLCNCVVTVTRYFGGTLLGTGGLVRAYGGAAKAALEAAEIVTVRLCVQLQATLEYTHYEIARRLLEGFGAKLDEPALADTVSLCALVPAENAQVARLGLTDATAGKALVRIGEPFYTSL